MLTAHAYIDVTAAEPAIAFYCDGLGLSVKRRLSPTWIELEGANLPIFLLADRPPYADLGSRQVPRSFERHWTPIHLDFIVADLDAAVARARRLGRVARPRHRRPRLRPHRLHGRPVRQRLRSDRVLRHGLRRYRAPNVRHCGLRPPAPTPGSRRRWTGRGARRRSRDRCLRSLPEWRYTQAGGARGRATEERIDVRNAWPGCSSSSSSCSRPS